VKFLGVNNEHPKDSNLLQGQQRSADLAEKILLSRYGKDCAVLITYDENGGRWDHVAPPAIDKWGPGTRVPGILLSPLARHGFVDKRIYESVSTLAFIEARWHLKPLSPRDANADPFSGAFDFPISAPAISAPAK
jgi:phospholipase C